MIIAILGTRGIPNRHGGFEQLAEKLAYFLAGQGHYVIVYNQQKEMPLMHPNIMIRKIFPFTLFKGGMVTWLFDFFCLIDVYWRKVDIILECGYTFTPFLFFFPRVLREKLVVMTDGLEWKRKKWKTPVKILIKWSEKLAAKKMKYLVSDHMLISNYWKEYRNRETKLLGYGADVPDSFSYDYLKILNLEPDHYYLAISRVVPENHLEWLLKVFENRSEKFVLVANFSHSRRGRKILASYDGHPVIQLIDQLYDTVKLNTLRHHCRAYFHGHSSGGTNPSLLEAMACQALIIAHKNVFNQYILGKDALFFQDINEIHAAVESIEKNAVDKKNMRQNNLLKVQKYYSWEHVLSEYESYFKLVRPGRETASSS